MKIQEIQGDQWRLKMDFLFKIQLYVVTCGSFPPLFK